MPPLCTSLHRLGKLAVRLLAAKSDDDDLLHVQRQGKTTNKAKGKPSQPSHRKNRPRSGNGMLHCRYFVIVLVEMVEMYSIVVESDEAHRFVFLPYSDRQNGVSPSFFIFSFFVFCLLISRLLDFLTSHLIVY